MTPGYTKLFSTIVTSSIWSLDDKTRIVWVTMMATCTRDGIVEAALPGLARAANVPLEDCKKAIEILESPDPYSRTEDHEGRRIEKCDGGWRLLNYVKYSEKMSLEIRREYFAKKQKEYRQKKKVTDKEKTLREVARERLDAEDKLDRLEESKPPYTATMEKETPQPYANQEATA